MKQKVVLSVISIFCTFFLLCSLSSRADAPLDRIVAVVNDSVITQSQLDKQIDLTKMQLQQTNAPLPPASELRSKVLQNLIDEQLQLQMAQKAGIKVSDDDLNQAIAHIAQQNGISVDDLKSKLAAQGMNYDQYQQQIRKQMLLNQIQQQMVASKVSVSQQEISDVTPILAKQPAADASYHLLDMYVPLSDHPTTQQVNDAQQRAQGLITKLRAGADFQQVVSASTTSSTPLQGGDLGWHTINEMPDAFVGLVKNMQVGDVGGPIRAANGFHIIKLAEVHGNSQTSHNLVQTHVRHILIKPTPLANDTQVKDRLTRLRAQILNGADFAKLAEINSQDPGSKIKGGDLGWVEPGELDPTFEAQMNKLKPGDTSEPFKSQFGWHIVQVLGRKTVQDNKAYLKEQASQLVYQRKVQEALKNWLQGLRSQAYIKIYP
jgi:peptidyl-prolyl cis-trans isomerase SurA